MKQTAAISSTRADVEDEEEADEQQEPGTAALIEGEFDDEEDDDFDEGAHVLSCKPRHDTLLLRELPACVRRWRANL